MASSSDEVSIRVCARFRPQNDKEQERGGLVCVETGGGVSLQLTHPQRGKLEPVNFDRVFDETSTQEQVYEECCGELIDHVMQGYNCTVFAYGQTGSGKTFTMEGELGSEKRGIVPRVIEDLFGRIAMDFDDDYDIRMKISYVEIYNNKIKDLLNPGSKNKISIGTGKYGIKVGGVAEEWVSKPEDVMTYFAYGANNRATGSTLMNDTSSRSHGVLMLKIVCEHKETKSTTVSKLMMVDLAGSERAKSTGATGDRLKEGQAINLSLMTLNSVLNALTTGRNPPYRESILTKLLEDSLGGRRKTTLIVCASSSNCQIEETRNALRFATRAKKVKNTAKINKVTTAAEYKQMWGKSERENRLLKTLIAWFEYDLNMSLADELTNILDAGGPVYKKELEEKEGIEFDIGKDVKKIIHSRNPSSTGSGNQVMNLPPSSSFESAQKMVSISEATENEMNELKDKTSELEEKQEKSRRLVAKMKTELLMLKEGLREAQEQLKSVTKEREGLEQSSKDKNSEIESLAAENIELKIKQESADRKETQLSSHLEDTENKLHVFQRKITQMEEYQESEIEKAKQEEKDRLDKFLIEAREAMANRMKHRSTGSSGGQGRFANPTESNPHQFGKHSRQNTVSDVDQFLQAKVKVYQQEQQLLKKENRLKKEAKRMKEDLENFGKLKMETDSYHLSVISKLQNDLRGAVSENTALKSDALNRPILERMSSTNSDTNTTISEKKLLKSLVAPVGSSKHLMEDALFQERQKHYKPMSIPVSGGMYHPHQQQQMMQQPVQYAHQQPTVSYPPHNMAYQQPYMQPVQQFMAPMPTIPTIPTQHTQNYQYASFNSHARDPTLTNFWPADF